MSSNKETRKNIPKSVKNVVLDNLRDIYIEIDRLENMFGEDEFKPLNSLIAKLRYSVEDEKCLTVIPRRRLKREECKADTNYRLCLRCDTYVHKKGYARHQRSSKCKDILAKKYVSKQSQSLLLDPNELIKNETEKSHSTHLKKLKAEANETDTDSDSDSDSESESESD